MANRVESKMRGMVAAIEDDTDFTIRLGAFRWRVHAEVLMRHSMFFKAMLDGPWTETKSDTAEVHDDSPWMFVRMLQYFYGGDFDYKHDTPSSPSFVNGGGLFVPQSTRPNPIPTISKMMTRVTMDTNFQKLKASDEQLTAAAIDAAMYFMADKYGVEHLRAYSLRSFKLHTVDSSCLKTICSEDFRTLMDQDDGLKQAVAQKIASCYDKLREQDSVWLEEWITSDAKFGLSIMDAMRGIDRPAQTSSSGAFGSSTTRASPMTSTSQRSAFSFGQSSVSQSSTVFAAPSRPSQPSAFGSSTVSTPHTTSLFGGPRP